MTVENLKRPTAKHTPHKPQSLGAAQSPDTLLRAETVQDLLGIGKSTLFKITREGTFVQPIRMGRRCTRWRAGDVTDWLKSQYSTVGKVA